MTVRDDLRKAIAGFRDNSDGEEHHLHWLLGEVERHLNLGEPPAPAPERPDGRASVATWREHAEALGVAVPEDAPKADIVAAVDAATPAPEPAAPAVEATEAPASPTSA